MRDLIECYTPGDIEMIDSVLTERVQYAEKM